MNRMMMRQLQDENNTLRKGRNAIDTVRLLLLYITPIIKMIQLLKNTKILSATNCTSWGLDLRYGGPLPLAAHAYPTPRIRHRHPRWS